MSINVNDKNLGHATAYAYYKAGGGTMTEAEFTEFMADFGTASQTAVEAAQAALASKNAAQTAATTATNKASEATTAATTATTKAGEASTSASTATSAKDTAVSASQTATTKATEATTAAATAVSAKDDAVSANTAAQSAKTAAQTAKTAAETAAASVQSSAAQIATNAEDISQLKSDITNLKSDFLEYEKIKGIINRFDKTTINAGKYVIPTNGNLADSSAFFASDYIFIGDLAAFKASRTHIIAFYNSQKVFVSAPTTQNTINSDATISVPDNVAFLRFSTYNDYVNDAQIGANVSRSNYVPYGIKEATDIIVDANGGGDYTSLTEALFDNVDNGINIIVKEGTYDIVSEYVSLFGQTAVDNMADADSATFNGFQFGAIIRNRKIEFMSGSHVVCDWTGHTIDGIHRFSAIRVDYNAEIIGLDLVATGTFYAIHDDYGLENKPYTVKYENCKIIGYNLYNVNCIGGGCKKYSRHIINNCYFNNNRSDVTLRYHNTNASGAEPEIYVSNSFFNNVVRFNYYGSQTSKMRVFVNNSKAYYFTKTRESASYDVDNVELYTWCNEETNPQV